LFKKGKREREKEKMNFYCIVGLQEDYREQEKVPRGP